MSVSFDRGTGSERLAECGDRNFMFIIIFIRVRDNFGTVKPLRQKF
jgi:hypothetical protein